MFSLEHIIWIIICVAIIGISIYFLTKYKVSLKNLLTVACILRVIGDMVKVFSTIEMVPNNMNGLMVPYLKLQYLPLHLCGLQVIFLFYARFTKNEKGRNAVLAFMYPTCMIGGFISLLIPSIFTDSISLSQAFTHPLAYQFFLYHTLLVIVGIYIPLSKQVKLNTKSYLATLLILFGTAYLAIYVNSMCAVPVFEGKNVVAVDYITDFFSLTYTPIGIPLKTIGDWYLYLVILMLIAIVLMGLFYIPYFIKDYKDFKKKKTVRL